MVSASFIRDIIDSLLQWYNMLVSSADTVISILNTEVIGGWTIGGFMFGVGASVFVGYVITKWVVDIIL